MTVPAFEQPPPRQRAFNLPGVVVGAIAVLAAIHAVRELLLDDDAAIWVIANFAFIPDRTELAAALAGTVGLVPGAGIWSFVTYALLHGSVLHLVLNSVWLIAFGSPLAWRFGAARFLLFSAAAAVGGALVQLAVHSADITPMIGASAAVSAYMAGAARFFFIQRASGLVPGPPPHLAPAVPLSVVFTDRRTLAFVGVWLGINLIFGLTGIGGDGSAIAWEAHLGGFAVGLLLFPLFDPVGTVRVSRPPVG